MSNSRRLLRSKFFWVAVLYFSEGFPFGIFFDVLPVYLRREGVNLADIGALSLLGLAWTLKFLWAPAIDYYRHHRLWMACADLGMGAALLAFAAAAGFGPWMWGVIGVITVLSATNDIAVDAYTIEILDRDEMGLANGIRIGFYRVGMLAAGAVLILPDWIGWPSAFGCAAALLGANAIAMLCAPREPVRERAASASLRGTLSGALKHPRLAAGLACFGLFAVTLVAIEIQRTRLDAASLRWMGMLSVVLLAASATLLRSAARAAPGDVHADDPVLGGLLELFSRREILAVLAFVLIFKLGDASMGFMVKPFWVDSGFSLTEIGLVSVNIGLGLSIAGGLVGGWYCDRVGIFRALWVLGLYQALSNLGYAGVAAILPGPGDITGWHRAAMYAASATESFTGGLGTAAFLAFLMAIVDKRHSAAEYALLSSVFALSRSVAGWGSGFGAQQLGYSSYFLLTFFLSFPAYALLPWVRRALENSDAREADGGLAGAPAAAAGQTSQ